MTANQETRMCQNCKALFTIDAQDFDFYEKLKVPPPTFCPKCRLQRRLTWRNMRSLYKRPCDLCKKEVIGIYAPEKPYKVYCSPCWWSDLWDTLEYGREYDFSRPFFDQLGDLMNEVPLLGRFVFEDTMVNSDYTNMAGHLKDCYLTFNTNYTEGCSYSNNLNSARDCIDVSYAIACELCYQCTNIQNCYRLFYSRDCNACRDSYFLKDCSGCSNCVGCVGLRNKQYYIFNQAYTKEEYHKKIKELGLETGSRPSMENVVREAEKVWQRIPVKYLHGTHNAEVSGDYITNSKNVKQSFHMNKVEDSKFCTYLMFGNPVKESYDFTQYGDGAELMYETLQAGEGIYNNHFGWCIWRQTKNTQYGVLNVTSSDCFGCIGVRNKQYCILNKQYTKDEYENMYPRIIEHMNAMPFTDKKGRIYTYGEFFPSEFSPFGYNETTAQEEFPLEKEQAVVQGYSWYEPRASETPQVTKNANDLPNTIEEIEDSLLKEVVSCMKCQFPYRYIAGELSFYKAQRLPLAQFCPRCRYAMRLEQKNPPRLWHRTCQCAGDRSQNTIYKNMSTHFHGTSSCSNEFETSYAPERPEIVYCEQCYQAEVV